MTYSVRTSPCACCQQASLTAVDGSRACVGQLFGQNGRIIAPRTWARSVAFLCHVKCATQDALSFLSLAPNLDQTSFSSAASFHLHNLEINLVLNE